MKSASELRKRTEEARRNGIGKGESEGREWQERGRLIRPVIPRLRYGAHLFAKTIKRGGGLTYAPRAVHQLHEIGTIGPPCHDPAFLMLQIRVDALGILALPVRVAQDQHGASIVLLLCRYLPLE